MPAGRYHEQIQIENNSKGHSYEKLLGRFVDDQLTEVTVEDPYVRTTHQVGKEKIQEFKPV